MPRKSLFKDKDTIQIVVTKEKKQAFDAWCLANETTMSDMLRRMMDDCLKTS